MPGPTDQPLPTWTSPPRAAGWGLRLRSTAQDWWDEARRLAWTVETPALAGNCGRALTACGDAVAAELAALAARIDGLA